MTNGLIQKLVSIAAVVIGATGTGSAPNSVNVALIIGGAVLGSAEHVMARLEGILGKAAPQAMSVAEKMALDAIGKLAGQAPSFTETQAPTPTSGIDATGPKR